MTHKEKIVKHYKRKRGLAKNFLLALRLLLKAYEDENLDYSSYTCPLCRVISICKHCPWSVLSNDNCVHITDIINSGKANQRKKQIRYWIKSYEAAVKELIKGGKV